MLSKHQKPFNPYWYLTNEEIDRLNLNKVWTMSHILTINNPHDNGIPT